MKDNLIGTKAIAQQTPEQWSQAIAKQSKAWEMFRKGLEEVRKGFGKCSGNVWRGSGEVEKGMDQV